MSTARFRSLAAFVTGAVLALASTAPAAGQDEGARQADDEPPRLRGFVDGRDAPGPAPETTAGAVDEVDPEAPAPETVAAEVSAPGAADRGLADEPFAPAGIRAGAFVLYPALETRVGYSDNVDQRPELHRSGSYLRVMPELAIESRWRRHALRGRIGAAHRTPLHGAGDETTDVEAELAGVIDVAEDTTAQLSAGYLRAPESRGEPGVPAAVVDPPTLELIEGEGRLERAFGRLRLGLRASAARESYGEAELADGTVVDNRDRAHVALETALRGGVEVVEDTVLFVEAGVNRRRFDRRVDRNGRLRGSRGTFAFAGVEMRRGGPLSGEIGVGYQRQDSDDPRLPDIEGPILRGEVTWEPTALTTVTLTGSLLPEESVLDSDAAGARVLTADLAVAHALRRNLVATAELGYSRSRYVGSARRETWRTASLELEYLASRWLSFIAEGGHRRLAPNIAGEGYDETWIELGMRLQR